MMPSILSVARTAVAIAQHLPPEFWSGSPEDSTDPTSYVARSAIELERLATVGDDRDAWGVTHDWEWAARMTAFAIADGAGPVRAAAVGFKRSELRKKKRSARATTKR